MNLIWVFFTNFDCPRQADTSHLWLASWPLKVIMPRSHPLAGKKSLSCAQLAGEPFVVYATSDYCATESIKTLCGFTPFIQHQTSHPLLLPSLVSAGQGIAIVPESFRPIIPASRVIMKDIPLPTFKLDLTVHWLKSNPSQTLSTFINFIYENTDQSITA